MLGLARWRPQHLLAAWISYWAALVVVKMGGAVNAVADVSGPNGHGSASAGFGDQGVTFTVVKGAATIWSGSASLPAVALWVAGPPLLLWIAWMLNRPRRATKNGVAPGIVDWPQDALRAGQEAFVARRREEIHERQSRD